MTIEYTMRVVVVMLAIWLFSGVETLIVVGTNTMICLCILKCFGWISNE